MLQLITKPPRDLKYSSAAALVSENARIRETFAWQPRYGNLDTIVTHALEWERQLSQRRENEAKEAA